MGPLYLREERQVDGVLCKQKLGTAVHCHHFVVHFNRQLMSGFARIVRANACVVHLQSIAQLSKQTL
eukprot:SAG31_NODE_336_length_17493_cov_20.694032_3_plen_67_part_00